MKLLEILLDNKSAWTGLHVYVRDKHVAYASIDPTFPGGPKVSARLGTHSASCTVPHVRWNMAAKSRIAMWVYRHQQAILHRMDNRYRKVA